MSVFNNLSSVIRELITRGSWILYDSEENSVIKLKDGRYFLINLDGSEVGYIDNVNLEDYELFIPSDHMQITQINQSFIK